MGSEMCIRDRPRIYQVFTKDLPRKINLYIANRIGLSCLPGNGVGRISIFRPQKSRDPVGSRGEKSRDPVKPRIEKSRDPVKPSVKKSHDPVKPRVEKSRDPVKPRVKKVVTPLS